MSDIRLPLDLLLILDTEDLEHALNCEYAIEYEQEIQFCKDDDELQEIIEDMDNPKYYKIDDIENDRIQAIIDLLNKSEEDVMLGRILDRIVR